VDIINQKKFIVSLIKTPSEYIEEDYDGNSYPTIGYMTSIADMFYPGWRVRDLSQEKVMSKDGELLYIQSSLYLEWPEIIDGQLIWIGGPHSDAEQVQYRKGTDKSDLKNVINLGNHFKGSITRALKKAFNTYMRICDDIYFNTRVDLSTAEVEQILEMVKESNIKDKEKENVIELINNSLLTDVRDLKKKGLELNRAFALSLIKTIRSQK
jgi:hypothetical protein